MAGAVKQVAELAHSTGYREGLEAGRAEAATSDEDSDLAAAEGEILGLREALAASRDRQKQLERALAAAQAVIDLAAAEIEAAIGPL